MRRNLIHVWPRSAKRARQQLLRFCLQISHQFLFEFLFKILFGHVAFLCKLLHCCAYGHHFRCRLLVS